MIDVVLAVAEWEFAPAVRPRLRGWIDQACQRIAPLGNPIVVTANASKLVNDRTPPLVPELWAAGLQRARADWVVFTSLNLEIHNGWMEEIQRQIASVDESIAGIGGSIVPGVGWDQLSSLDRSVYALRYARYGRTDLPYLFPPGEHAAYRRSALLRPEIRQSWADGFWECDVQRTLVSHQYQFCFVPNLTLAYRGGLDRAAMMRNRYWHARQFGAKRGAIHQWGWPNRLIRSLGAPIAAGALMYRSLHQMRHQCILLEFRDIGDLLGLALAWSCGEAVGLLKPALLRSQIHAERSAEL